MNTYEAVGIVCWGVIGGVCRSCFLSVIADSVVTEPLQEGLVGGGGVDVNEF